MATNAAGDKSDKAPEQTEANAASSSKAGTAGENESDQSKEHGQETSVRKTSQPSASAMKPAPVHDVQSLLNQLALSGIAGKREGKAPEDYKFWNTQPVPKFKEPNLLQTTTSSDSQTEGAILPDETCRKSAKAEPEKLLEGFEWCLVDLEDDAELTELYELLENHYVEDTDGTFRFKYGKDFLSWALKPPGWKRDWHIGVRTKGKEEGKKGKLVAFIAGIPVTLKVGDKTVNATEINFLNVHRRLRGKRLAPVLIKEVTRRCYLNGIYQALYTAGTLLPTPVTTCRYFHRSLDWAHLFKMGFSHLPHGTTEMRMRLRYKLEPQTSMKGLRPMEERDVGSVRGLLARYLERFHMRQEWSREEIQHWLCSAASKGVVSSFVVEGRNGEITDFVSYYLLDSTVLRSSTQRESIRAAYLYYYASTAAFPSATNNPASTLAPRLQALMHEALILAAKDGYHVFNAVTILDNPLFLKEQKFEPGDGKLHYYLFNWRTRPLGGGIDEKNHLMDPKKMGGVGVVML